MSISKFEELGLSVEVLKAIEDMGFDTPSKIQEQAIPVVLEGKDVIGQAQTGTGKTLAFGGGLLSNVYPSKNRLPQAIILSPTRELAMQIHEEMQRIGKYNGSRMTCVFGGSDIERQIRDLKKGVDIVVGTPGRVMDLMRRKALRLSDVRYVVLDEADEMLNMGFVEDIETILDDVPEERQTILFSATMPQAIKVIASHYMKKDHEHIAIAAKTRTASTVKQSYYEVKQKDRFEALCRLIDVTHVSAGIIFCRTKRSVDEVCENMQKAGYSVEAMHGDLTQNHRMNTLRKFKNGTIKFLVATDVAARGIDVENVSHVINYELPQDIESYIHRIGRTGRANKEGLAYSIITPREKSFLGQIQRVTNSKIEKQEIPTFSQIEQARMDHLLSEVEDAIFAGKHKKFKTMVNEIDPAMVLDFTAALLQMHYQDKPGYGYTRESLSSAESSNGRKKGSKYARIFITAGTMDRVKVPQIISFFCDKAGISKDDIGAIDIKRKFSFVDLNPKVVEQVIENCNHKKINNRKIDIEIANKK
ncbi:DEAD/DEAH box helicase [Tannockella kyphosi]|uniref:DEAD/DEAH box helicase n=1 Tax=Tannockella kyphosi TaxID=2899121 RepID=UPI0020134799|nr:DEAD/DEAH box helicase [Tannockella kyphosi]